jgi:hypothetical protein
MARAANLSNEWTEQLINVFQEEPCLPAVNEDDYMNRPIHSRAAALGHIGGIKTLSCSW